MLEEAMCLNHEDEVMRARWAKHLVGLLIAEMQIEIDMSDKHIPDGLDAAPYNGDPIRVQDLLDRGANAWNRSRTPFRGSLIATASSVWHWESAVEVAEILIKTGADVNAVSERHGTALQAASRNLFF